MPPTSLLATDGDQLGPHEHTAEGTEAQERRGTSLGRAPTVRGPFVTISRKRYTGQVSGPQPRIFSTALLRISFWRRRRLSVPGAGHELQSGMNPSRIALLALLVAGLLAPGTQAAGQTFTFDRSFPAIASIPLDVTTERGKITVRAGTTAEVVVVGRVSVRVRWNVPANAVALARSTANQPPLEHAGDTVRLQMPSDNRTRRAVTIAYEVQVPADTQVVTHSESGETRVEGVRGAVSVQTQSAAIKLADLGETGVETGSGAVFIDGAGPLRVTTSSGGIEAKRISGNLYVRTQSGRVIVSFDNEGDVDVETGSSAITIDGLDGGLAASTKSGRVQVSGNPRRPWQVTTGSSAIDAVFSTNAAFTLDATSGSGSVKAENLVMRGETDKRRVAGSIDGGGPSVHLSSRSGSITLKR